MELKSLIEEWLYHRRAVSYAAIQSQGLPLLLGFQIQSMVFTDDGRSETNSEIRALNSLRNIDIYRSVETVAGPMLDEEAVDLAKKISDTHGSTLPFFSPFSVVKDNLADKELLDGGKLSEGTVWALDLLARVGRTYLTGVTSLGFDDHALANKLSEELLDFAVSPTQVTLVSIPIGNVTLAGNTTAQFGQARVRELTPEEAAYLNTIPLLDVGNTLPGLNFRSGFLGMGQVSATHVLEWRETVDKTLQGGLLMEEWKRTLLGLYLGGVDVAGPGLAFIWSELSWMSIGRFTYPAEMLQRIPAGGPATLDDKALKNAIELGLKIPSAVFGQNPSGAEEIAIQRFSSSLPKKADSERLIDLVTALEGLLLSDVPDEHVGELSYRFSVNGAAYLEDRLAERKKARKSLKTTYDARSQLVHKQSKQPDPSLIKSRADEAYEWARKGIRKAVETSWPINDDFLKILFS